MHRIVVSNIQAGRRRSIARCGCSLVSSEVKTQLNFANFRLRCYGSPSHNRPFSTSPLPSSIHNEDDDDDIDESQISSAYYDEDEIRPTNNNKRHKIYSHQNGYGKIVANTSTSHHDTTISTHLTDIQHSSPMRLVPSRRTNPIYHNDNRTKQTQKYEAALIHLSSYGGGLVPGD